MIKIKGTVESVIFYNPENGYAVCDVACMGELITMTGSMPSIAEGENIIASGSWVTHDEYGDQFKVEYIERIMPKKKSRNIFRPVSCRMWARRPREGSLRRSAPMPLMLLRTTISSFLR